MEEYTVAFCSVLQLLVGRKPPFVLCFGLPRFYEGHIWFERISIQTFFFSTDNSEIIARISSNLINYIISGVYSALYILENSTRIKLLLVFQFHSSFFYTNIYGSSKCRLSLSKLIRQPCNSLIIDIMLNDIK